MTNESISRYYGIALTADGKFGLLLVTKRRGERSAQEWTGEAFATQPEAERAMDRMNRALFGGAS